MNIIAIMDDHAAGKSTCGREMGNNESSWSGLILCTVVTSMLRQLNWDSLEQRRTKATYYVLQDYQQHCICKLFRISSTIDNQDKRSST